MTATDRPEHAAAVTPPSSETTADDAAADLALEEAQRKEAEARMKVVATEYFGRLTDAAQQLTAQANHVYGLSRQYVQAHPAPVVLFTLGLGLAVGLLSARH
jgi:ElaB/YqjD/DUF883 family membrane-anchored ribosome-binding protein